MAYHHKIRFRIFLSYPVLGLVLSVFMLVFLKLAFISLERQFMDSYLTEELEHFIRLTEKDPALSSQQSKNWAIYKVDVNRHPEELAFLSGYPGGIYDVEHNQRGYDVAIKQIDKVRYYILYDDTDFETLEYHLMMYLLVAVVIIFWLTLWYGLWFSKKVIEPVTSLAARIKTLKPESSTAYLVQDYTNDEVGILALEFDAYRERLQALIQREREFTGNASHELRTPLAIIMAAAESLLLRPELGNDIKPRLERIQRSARDMAERLDMLLSLARSPVNSKESLDKTELEAMVGQLIDDHAGLLAKEVRVVRTIRGNPSINAPGPIVSMLMSNLIKNAFTYTRQGEVTITLDEQSFWVTDTGEGIAPDEVAQVFKRGYRGVSSEGSGLGLAIAKRICEHYGWQLRIDSCKNKGTQVQWLFN